eukprot:Gb_26947 [translate_table: standard]
MLLEQLGRVIFLYLLVYGHYDFYFAVPDEFVEVCESLTTGPSHAVDIAREAIRGGAAAVIAVGGDGTLHEVCFSVFNAKNNFWSSPQYSIGATALPECVSRSKPELPTSSLDAEFHFLLGRPVTAFIEFSHYACKVETCRFIARPRGQCSGNANPWQRLASLLHPFKGLDILILADIYTEFTCSFIGASVTSWVGLPMGKLRKNDFWKSTFLPNGS